MAEIDCISLSKAMAAGAIPITTDFGALGEKRGQGGEARARRSIYPLEEDEGRLGRAGPVSFRDDRPGTEGALCGGSGAVAQEPAHREGAGANAGMGEIDV